MPTTFKLPFVRSQYNYDTDKASNESGLECKDPSLAQQNQRDEADINTIVRRFGLTGELPSGVRMPQYGDFTEVTDYQTALNAVKAADEVFMQLPADIRNRFRNNPEDFVEFCLDPANRDEAEKMGLVVPVEKPAAAAQGTPEPVPAVTPKA